MMRATLTTIVVATAALLGQWGAPCLAKEKQEVVVSYVIAPERPLPEGLEAVAVLDTGVQTEGARQDEREARWSTIAADMIEAMLLNANRRFKTDLAVANRRATQQVLAEQDLRLAGLVQGETAARAGKLLEVQGLITSKITVHMDVQRGTSSAIDWQALLGGAAREWTGTREGPAGAGTRTPPPPRKSSAPKKRYGTTKQGYPTKSKGSIKQPTGKKRPVSIRQPVPVKSSAKSKVPAGPHDARRLRHLYYPTYRKPAGAGQEVSVLAGLRLETKTVEQVRRHLTVQCSFSLIDAATGEALIRYSPPPFQKQDTASPDFLFRSLLDEGELDPVDHFIGELVERAAREFVSMIVPVQVEYPYELVGRGDAGEAGIRALRADDYETAMRHLRQAAREDDDEHETVFAMAVTCELMGRPEEALSLYNQAVAMEDVDDDELAVYLAARDRLKAHLGRIKPAPTPAM